MTTQTRVLPRLSMLALLLVLATVSAVAKSNWGDVVKSSQRVQMGSESGIAYGEVDEGFASFALDLDSTGPLTIEIVVTEQRQGRSYNDDDSMLWLFDANGYLIAENDDGPYDSYASLINGVDISSPGRYYAVVTTHPNRPEMDFDNRFVEVRDDGESSIAFELIVEWGIREVDDYGYGYDSYEEAETEIWFDDFRSLATPLRYTGGELVVEGTVSDGVALYRLTSSDSVGISAGVRAVGGEYSDTLIFLFDSTGNLIAENDDAGEDGGSLIYDAYIEENETYYVAVTSYPNWPNYDGQGYVEGFPLRGEGSIEFELTIGPWQEYVYYDDPYYGGGETEIWFGDFGDLAIPLRYTGGELRMLGFVSEGVALYRLTTPQSQSVSIGVGAIEGAYGDTVLFLIDSEGNSVAENDDGTGNGGSLIYDVYLEAGEAYFVAVTSFPNWPNYDSEGFVEGFPLDGDESIDFELVVGPPQEYSYGDDGYYNAETAIWFDQFDELAVPIRYEGGETVVRGVVGSGVAIYRLSPRQPISVSIEVAPTHDEDSVLYVFDHDGYLIEEDDDGGTNGGSLIHDIYLDQTDGYFVAVVTFGNSPNMDGSGYLEGFPESGGAEMDFDLIIGPPREGGYDYYGGEPYPDNGMPANSFGDVVSSAQYIPITNGRGIGAGEVGIGYSAFELVITNPLYLTIEVVVTEVRQGVSYADSDSKLSLYGADGHMVASDDDGGTDGASKIDGVQISNPGTYYAIVTTYPNDPNPSGDFPFIDTTGGSNIAFDLVVRTSTAAQ